MQIAPDSAYRRRQVISDLTGMHAGKARHVFLHRDDCHSIASSDPDGYRIDLFHHSGEGIPHEDYRIFEDRGAVAIRYRETGTVRPVTVSEKCTPQRGTYAGEAPEGEEPDDETHGQQDSVLIEQLKVNDGIAVDETREPGFHPEYPCFRDRFENLEIKYAVRKADEPGPYLVSPQLKPIVRYDVYHRV
jgi:hypothetical protein